MIYDVRHVTTYGYEMPVTFARCTLRLVPADGAGQRVLAHRIQVAPATASRAERTAFFGAASVFLTIESAHTELRIEARSRVEVTRDMPPEDETGPSWEEVRDLAFASDSLAPDSPAHHLYPSRAVALADPITAYARASFPARRPVLAGGIDLMRRIKADFAYTPRATEVSTSALEAFRSRHGVCQDFAHVMIAGLRGHGLPAAYVSGYIHTKPPPGRPRLQGADATHAWAALWCGPDLGWIGLDPTNGILVGPDHIVLAIGRDYADVSPIDGVILGSGAQKLQVAVDVIPV
ncbi:MAG TPA: transglutaminase family protein [Microvirga sp.]|nr:transglutaminase family protein [Microvirga sp.]